MPYAIDLNPRQTTRTLEQATRHDTEVLVMPRVRPEDVPIFCRLKRIEVTKGARAGRPYLVLAVSAEERPAGAERRDYLDLVGTYCDVTIQLGENRYMFCSDVVAVPDTPPGTDEVRLFLARPETIQVAQRRRFWRFRPAMSSQVELRWVNPDQSPAHGIGWLCNVSGNGLACRVDRHVADRLGIGEHLRTVFALAPGDPDRFTIEAELCSKTPAGTPGTIILGLQFLTGTGHESSAQMADKLSSLLLARYGRPIDSSKGADK